MRLSGISQKNSLLFSLLSGISAFSGTLALLCYSELMQREPRLVPQEFFLADPREVSRRLLGKILVRRRSTDRQIAKSQNRQFPSDWLAAGRIVEIEAYLGNGDPAAHAAAGKTLRNAVIFGPPGHAYVYFIYGTNFCLNISCLPEGEAGCILLRALQPLMGESAMAKARRLDPQQINTIASRRMLTSGPGRLCKALSITRERDNDKAIYSADSDLVVMDDGLVPETISETLRIGITKAADRPLRYVIADNPFVSGKRLMPATALSR
jgi:DNA-3-methyladenine glycosylase